MKKRKLTSLILAIALVGAAFTGCSGSSPANSAANSVDSASSQESNADGKHYKFGFTCETMNNPYFNCIQKTISDTVKAKGDTLISVDPQKDVQKQIDQVNDLIAQGVDAVFVGPVDYKGITPALKALKKAGVKVINYDNKVEDTEDIDAYVGSDNANAGLVVGKDMVKKFPNGGKIAVLGSPAANAAVDRVNGFKEGIKDGKFTIVSEQDGKGDLQTSMNVMTDILQAHPDIVAIFCGNDPSALGALSACKSANLTNISIYGVDGSPDAKKEIAKGGQFIGTGAQSPVNIAKTSVDIAYKILNGQSVQKDNPVQTFLITKDNVSQYGVDSWQ